MIVHPENPVADLSLEDIARIYTVAISNWNDVGGLIICVKCIDCTKMV